MICLTKLDESRRRESLIDALWVRGGCDGRLSGKMFGPIEEVRRAQATEAIGLKDIPAPNDEFFILIKRQEIPGLSVDMEWLTEQAKWKRTQSISMRRRMKTYWDRFTGERPVTIARGDQRADHHCQGHDVCNGKAHGCN